MPDLIIKPAAQSGNKVIIQDQAGGAVLTTGDSGATMSSNVTGIPAAGVTGVLPVGVTGGAGVGILQKVHTITASNDANVTFSSTYITSTYKRYTLEAYDIQCATDNQALMMHGSIDNGSNYLGSGNTRINISTASSAGNDAIEGRNTSNQGGIQLGGGYNFGTGTGEVGAFTFEFVNFSDTAHHKLFYYNGAFVHAGGNGAINSGAGVFGTTSAINNIKFAFGSGNITAGTFVLYGIV